MNIFDTLKKKAFDVVTNLMGYDASWTNSVSNVLLTAKVGYKDPSEKQELSGIDSWNPDQPFMEYRAGFFPGLKESVDAGVAEYVLITQQGDADSVIGYFNVKEVKTKVDGDTFVARLVKKPYIK
jgi:hypothetical protein